MLKKKIVEETKFKHWRRGRQDIIMGILRLARKGTTKYDMITAVGMSSAQCAEYLKYLTLTGYIFEEASGIWKTTEKGLLVIDACAICHGYLPQFNESELARVKMEEREVVTSGKRMGKAIDNQKGHKRQKLAAKRKEERT